MKSLVAGIIGLVFLLGVVPIVFANSVDDQIAARIKPVGSVCVEGQSCAAASASGTQAATKSSSSSSSEPGEATFNKVCATCHKTGVAGAPKFGDYKDWAPHIAKGMDVLYHSAIHGFKAMPPRGTCGNCTDDQLKAAVDYMVNGAKKNK